MIKLKDILKEIGEGTSKPYKYEYSYGDDESSNYTFTTEESNTDYEVDLIIFTEDQYTTMYGITSAETLTFPVLDISFKSVEGDYDEETNKNEQYRIMATVIMIVKEMLKRHKEIQSLVYAPTKADKDDTRRANLYKAYISKQIPGAQVSTGRNGKGYIVTLPNK